jgi:transcriptional regulator with GAF, ATPase, and Fis domain
MEELRSLIRKVARTEATVLIQGESGTGKELVAREIFRNSPRSGAPFIKVNCAAIPENLIESEFFGHEKGAFTGALNKREGRFELAHGGTILLDEISEISPAVQAKLLRVLQERELERVGGNRTIKVDVRVIATTNRHLEQSVERKEFRQDLYFRLNVVPIVVAPLRERKEDIPLLSEQFQLRFSRKHGLRTLGISPECHAALQAHNWPGNVRELQNVIERAVILCGDNDSLRPEHLGFPMAAKTAVAIAAPAPAPATAIPILSDAPPSQARRHPPSPHRLCLPPPLRRPRPLNRKKSSRSRNSKKSKSCASSKSTTATARSRPSNSPSASARFGTSSTNTAFRRPRTRRSSFPSTKFPHRRDVEPSIRWELRSICPIGDCDEIATEECPRYC